MWEGGGGQDGVELGGEWDNCNSIINKYIKKKNPDFQGNVGENQLEQLENITKAGTPTGGWGVLSSEELSVQCTFTELTFIVMLVPQNPVVV